jgi:hypothetical protein
MKVQERQKPGLLRTLSGLASSAMKLASQVWTVTRRRDESVATIASKPVAEIYHQKIIADPEKHIEELAAARKPYANVPFDMID